MTMFDVMRRMGYTRRLVDARSRIDRRHGMWPNQDAQFVAWREYFKFIPDRQEHPAYYTRRAVHPRFRHSYRLRQKIYFIEEAWIDKIERNSPRALKPFIPPVAEDTR